MNYFTLILTCVFSFLCFLFWFLKRNYDYWESRGVQCKKPEFPFGNFKDRIFMKISFHEFTENFYNEMKGRQFAGMYEGTIPVLYVFDPDLIKLILVKHFDHFTDRPIIKFKSEAYLEKMMFALEGNEWKKTRFACTPAFSSGRLKAMVPFVNACGCHMVQHLNKITEEKGEIVLDIKDLLINYTLDAIASTSFGINIDSYSEAKSEFAIQALQFQDMSIIKRMFLIICILYGIPQWITSFLPLTFFNDESIKFFAKTILETRKYRQMNNVRRNDLLQLLLDAQAAPVEIIGETEDEIINEKREVIDEETAIAQSVFFFIAGFETSSTHLSMACYELAKNKDVQSKTREDILKYWKDDELTHEAINSMTYLDMVMSETLRLYPPLARLERVVTKPINIGGLQLEKGTKIILPVIGLHHDEQYYPEPMSFKPERFLHEEKMKRNPYVYLAFGAGPRNCIGLRFANISSKICTAYLLKHYEIDICDTTPIPFVYDKRTFFLKAKDGLYLKLKRII